MNRYLLDIPTEELLEKFGKGSHIPGSGSAAAFQGMISAKLLVTVISLTCDEKRKKNYGAVVPELIKIQLKIVERIFPELTDLFHKDSYHFDLAIKFRESRDNEKDPAIQTNLERKALEQLKLAIDIPLDIASLNIELAEMASFVFDKGWKAVRGDSQVSLSGAVAAIAGCRSIINLNLLSFGGDEYKYIEGIRKKLNILKSIYDELNVNANTKIEQLENELKGKMPLYKEATEILSKVKSKSYLSDAEIENSAIELQLLLWKYRSQIWKEDSATPLKILNPAQALQKVFGYKYFLMEDIYLSDQEDYTNVAGMIDQRDKLVLISKQYTTSTQNFTTAHELGHAMLHSQLVMHRDIPLDGSSQSGTRSKEEIQADKFASYFLMPRKQIIKEFTERFMTSKFTIDEQSAFNLIKDGSGKLKGDCKNLRGLSRKLAAAERYENQSFNSMTEVFNVSVETMAIRLEELELVVF
jgi:formiminotetrahydrofolate cyclodeaminase